MKNMHIDVSVSVVYLFSYSFFFGKDRRKELFILMCLK